MQKTKQQLLTLALALWAFSSCSQDASDTEGSATVGETVTISLDAEISVDDSDLRAIEYKLGKNAKEQLVPMPQFTDGQEVEVHTILKSTKGDRAAKTLKWRYDAAKKKLVLKQTDGHSIAVSDLNASYGIKWYISGVIGGRLGGTRVHFMGTRVVKGVDGNVGDALGSMEVAYAFGWTELIINTKSPMDSGYASHKYAEVPKNKNVQFKPLGSILAVKLGTNQSAGAYTFTPKGFNLRSNAWGDQGYFELDTKIPTTNPHTSLPVFYEDVCAGNMYYTFADGEEPGTIAHNQTAPKTYYVWVMPYKEVPAQAEVSVMLQGTSSRPETATYKDYTNIWFTDYTIEAKTSQGKVTSGRVHSLTAKVTRRVALPIEYITDYNLAGGEGLFLAATTPIINKPVGLVGPLRFSNFDSDGSANSYGHRNDASGYYSWYELVGDYHTQSNRDVRNLQTEVDNIFGPGDYFIPTIEQWWGVYPSAFTWLQPWLDAKGYSNTTELMRIGLGRDVYRQAYSSDYSKSFTSPHGGNDDIDDAVFYAIRFKPWTRTCGPQAYAWDFDRTIGRSVTSFYKAALDNSLKCAYRFRRIGGATAWNRVDNTNMTNQLIIDVVYLGEEATPTELATISDESWWSTKQSEGQVISKTFPAAGYMTTSWILVDRGKGANYGSSTAAHSYTNIVNTSSLQISSHTRGNVPNFFPVRLFTRKGH